MKSKLVKIRYRALVLLIVYLAVLTPFLSGNMLCLSCCDASDETGAMQGCCCDDSDQDSDTECHGLAETVSLFRLFVVESSESNNVECMCIDIPIDTSEPHDIAREISQSPLSVATHAPIIVNVIRHDFTAPQSAIGGRMDTGSSLRSIILLI